VKRSTWLAVLGACALLVAAGNLPRVSWDGAASAVRDGAARAVASWPSRVRRTPAAAAAPAVVPAPVASRLAATPARPAWPRAAGPVASALAGALAGLALLALLLAALRRDPRARVLQLARAGRSTRRIAREARLPEDAVRTLLAAGRSRRR
jgi:hypothetical protein